MVDFTRAVCPALAAEICAAVAARILSSVFPTVALTEVQQLPFASRYIPKSPAVVVEVF